VGCGRTRKEKGNRRRAGSSRGSGQAREGKIVWGEEDKGKGPPKLEEIPFVRLNREKGLEREARGETYEDLTQSKHRESRKRKKNRSKKGGGEEWRALEDG